MRTKDLNKKDRIFKAALVLTKKVGIAGITMSKIAKEAQIATGTLYIYFKTKEELIHQLYVKLETESAHRFLQNYDDSLSFKKGIKTIWLNYLKHRIEYFEESIFIEQYYHSPYITQQQKEMAEDMKQPVYRLLETGKKNNEIKTQADSQLLFLAMLGFIRELAYEHIEGNYELNEERIEAAFQLNWRMLGS